MIGAVIGDIAGSFREFSKQKHNKYCDLPLIPTKEQIDEFKLKVGVTDDTVLTYATLKTLSEHKSKLTSLSYNDFALNYKEIGLRYFDPIGGYGGSFRKWLKSKDLTPYNSCGNGSAMRISPVVHFSNSVEQCLHLSFLSASATHNHPEGIKGAQSCALAAFLAKENNSWEEIKKILSENYLSYDPINYLGYFDMICQDTMRLAFWCLDSSHDFESAVKLAVTIKAADSDTLGAIVGSIAEYLYEVPQQLIHQAFEYLAKFPEIRMSIKQFYLDNEI